MSPEDADDTGAGILHIDMDAFYASVAILDDPSLKGIPLIIAGIDGRSVVTSASYEARRYGVRAAMPIGQARRLCPVAKVVPPVFERYQDVSKRVMTIFEEFTPLVEPLSIDEAFLDVRGARRLWGGPGRIARLIRARVEDEIGITCSVGAAATKHVAKMASTMAKPDGLLIVPEAETLDFLAPLSVRSLWGVGPKASETLESRAIRTIADIRTTPDAVLERAAGRALAQRLRELSMGRDARAVEPERVEKSIGHEETFEHDVSDRDLLRSELLRLGDRVAARLRRAGWEAGGVAIKIRFSDFTTVTRSQALSEPTSVGQRIGDVARSLFEGIDRRDPIRLVGVRAERLAGAGGDLALWDDDVEWRRVEGALDDARARFGSGTITRARHLGTGEGRGSARHPRAHGLD